MTWEDYKRTKNGMLASIGILDGQYVMEYKVQSGMVSKFYEISKEEYENYSEWCKDEEEISKIRLKKPWCQGFWLHSEFKMLKE